MSYLEAADHADIYVSHHYPELPAMLLIPAQTESWWGYEDTPLFASQTDPAVGPSIRQGVGPMFRLWHKRLGPQWSIAWVLAMGMASIQE